MKNKKRIRRLPAVALEKLVDHPNVSKEMKALAHQELMRRRKDPQWIRNQHVKFPGRVSRPTVFRGHISSDSNSGGSGSDVLDHPATIRGGHWESNRRKH